MIPPKISAQAAVQDIYSFLYRPPTSPSTSIAPPVRARSCSSEVSVLKYELTRPFHPTAVFDCPLATSIKVDAAHCSLRLLILTVTVSICFVTSSILIGSLHLFASQYGCSSGFPPVIYANSFNYHSSPCPFLSTINGQFAFRLKDNPAS